MSPRKSTPKKPKPSPRRQFGAVLRHAREDSKQTQAAVAGAATLSLQALGHIERGTRLPSLAALAAILRAVTGEPGAILENRALPHDVFHAIKGLSHAL